MTMIDASTRLRRAIHLADPALVARIIRNNPTLLLNPDFDDSSNTSLHLAATLGLTAIASQLIAAGHDATEISRNAVNDTPLMLAAQRGHVDVGKVLVLAFPRCVPMVNRQGLDALAMAAQRPGSTELIPILLAESTYPASPHVRDLEGNAPLHHASASGSLKALRILLQAGANPLAKNDYDWTPLAYSQTVAAEVYFKNLVAEFERRKVEGAKMSEERERQRAGGVRLVEDSEPATTPRAEGPDGEDAQMIGDALKRHWSPIERKRPGTPGAGSAPSRHEWGLQHMRARSASGD